MEKSDLNTLKVTSQELLANKYLCDEVKSFEKALSTDQYESEGLKPAYMQVVVKGKDVEEMDIKRFCEKINACYKEGLIEKAILAPVVSLPLARNVSINGSIVKETIPQRTLLFLFTFSKYDLPELRKRSGNIFNMEGEISKEFI